jgi:hypothetical protein
VTTEAIPKPSGADAVIQQLRTDLKREKAAGKKKDEEIAKLRPTQDVTGFMFETADDVRAFYGEERLVNKVKERVATQNRVLMRQGYERLASDDETIAAMVEELVEELVTDRHAEGSRPSDEGWLDRTIKMLKPPHPKTGERALIQIAYEGQINNVAGSLADGIVRYERKGYKRTEPMLCPSKDCWDPAATIDRGAQKGKWAFDGYCSEDHRNRTERGGATQKVPGLS